jgi:YD repeat-containing protein
VRGLHRVVAFAASMVAAAPCAVAQQQFPLLARGFQANRVYQFEDVDHVDILSGNLIIALPLGPSYPLNGGLSHQLTLSYNSNAWDYQEIGGGLVHANPSKRSNAGMGWIMGYGNYIPAGSSEVVLDTYEAPDGGDHGFNGVDRTTTDGTNLRLRRLSSNVIEIDFPDGRTQQFINNGAGVWEIQQIRSSSSPDRVTFTRWPGPLPDCQASVTGSTSSMTVSDTLGRTQVICYAKHTVDGISRPMVTRVVLAGPDSRKLTYSFEYDQNVEVTKPPGDNDPDSLGWRQTHRVSLLRAVVLPDGSKYDLTYVGSALGRVALPTLGEIAYEYGARRMPSADACSNVPHKGNPPGGVILGVTKRTLSSIAPSGQTPPPPRVWSYDGQRRRLGPLTQYFQLMNCGDTIENVPFWDELVVTVTDPDGHKTVNHFNIYSLRDDEAVSPAGFSRRHFGLPYGLFDPARNRFLSQEMFTCVNATCKTSRSVWVRHDFDSASTGSEPFPDDTGIPNRLASQEIVFHDDPSPCETGCWSTVTDFTDWDGYGHYRTTTTQWPDPTMTSIQSKTSTTAWNKVNGVPRIIQSFDPWILNTHEGTRVTDGASVNVAQACFDLSTGFMRARRQLAGTSPGSTDMLAAFERNTEGNLQREQYFGGDRSLLPSGANQTFLCSALSSLGTPEYQVDHTWQNGVLAKSKYLGVNFFSMDQTIDATGVVKSERDTAGLTTTYAYDPQGRLSSVVPQGMATTTYSYGNATKSGTTLTAPASVVVQTGATGISTTTKVEYQYDPFGRLWREKLLTPAGGWSLRETLYDKGNRLSSVSEVVALPAGVTELSFSPSERTQYESYDSDGRPLQVRATDGSLTIFNYTGMRKKTRTVTGGGTTPLSMVTTEGFDGLGRLTSVREDAQPVAVTAEYGYDAGDRLRSVRMSGDGGVQNRSFNYDGRGVLVSETHPESGVTSYKYDSRGHIVERTSAVSTLVYAYDPAERIASIKSNGNDLKVFGYDRPNAGIDASMGKLDFARRHNRNTSLGADVTVTETYKYEGAGGRISRKTTSLSTGKSFVDEYNYDAHGNLVDVHYPKCTGCPLLTEPTRDLTQFYTAGRVTNVSGYAKSVTYHPNGLVQTIEHVNADSSAGPRYTQSIVSSIPRPASIEVTNFCDDFGITTPPQSKTVPSGSPAGLTVAAPGATAFQWNTRVGTVDTPLAGETSSTLNVAVTAQTTYWVRVGNGTCTVDSQTVVVSVGCAAPDASITTTPSSSIKAFTTGTASVPATSGATYSWSITNGTITGGAGASSMTFRANCSGSSVTLNVTVTAGCGARNDGSKSLSLSGVTAVAFVTGASTINQGGSTTIRATLTGTAPWTVTWSPDNVTQTITSGTTADRTVSPSATTTYTVSAVSDANCSGTASGQAAVTVVPPTPKAVLATAASPTQITISWSSSGSPDSFEIERRGLSGPVVTSVGSSPITQTVTSGRSYLYRVRAIKSGTPSAWSASDLATTVIFSNDPVGGATPVAAVHLIELQTAVNAVRALAGMTPASFSGSVTSGVIIDKLHVQELRTSLDQARGNLGLIALSYTNHPLTAGTIVRAVHINELRGGVK